MIGCTSATILKLVQATQRQLAAAAIRAADSEQAPRIVSQGTHRVGIDRKSRRTNSSKEAAMSRRSRIAAGLFVAACASTGAFAQGEESPFTLTSPAFRDGATLEQRNGGNLAGNSNCVGNNVQPALTWSNAPPGTRRARAASP